MAVKTVSQLDRFDNGNLNDSKLIGGNLVSYPETALTDSDRTGGPALGKKDVLSSYNEQSFYRSLIEISKPSQPGAIDHGSPLSAEYSSMNIEYNQLVKNIIWDVKAFLNYHNNIDDYDLSAIVDGEYTGESTRFFHGNKRLGNGNLSIDNGLFANNASISSLVALSSELQQQVNICCDVYMNKDHFISGYAYGLKSDSRNTTSAGSVDSISVGFPVCFEDGRPKAMSCVNYALKAYNLISSDGNLISVGNGALCSIPGIESKYSAIYISAGIPYATNIIDFAEHAYWSDLGERYEADAKYEPGTLVKFGGDKEITIADTEVNAIVSTKAFDLNAGLKDGIVIALCGRVPTKVKGKIAKFDKIMLSEIPGIACKWDGTTKAIGTALKSNDNEDVKLVECVTRFEI